MGERQARALGKLLADVCPALVLTSPRQRARRTAELAGLAELCPVRDRARPRRVGVRGVRGHHHAGDPAQSRPDWTIWTGDPPGGETAEQVRVRADRVLDRIRAALATGPVVAIGHGHFSRVLAARWLGLPVSSGGMFVLGPASPCLLGHEHGRPAIHRWNVPNPAERDPG